MDTCLFTPPDSVRRTFRAVARPSALKEALTTKEGQSCRIAVVLCSAEARPRNQKPIAARRDLLSSRATRPFDASRGQPRSLAGDTRRIETGRTYLPASCDAHPPTQAPNPALEPVNAVSGASRPCEGLVGPFAPSAAAVASIAAQQQKGTPLASTRRSKDQERPPRSGAPQSAAALGSPGRPVSRHARRLHGGAHPVADLPAGAADGAGVRAVRAGSRPAGAARPETAAATQPAARVTRA
jgi:hypothetical protein